MSTICLSRNTIIAGKWYDAGDLIESKILPAKLRPFITKPEPKSENGERNLMFKFNQSYSVDSEAYLKPNVGRQLAQLEAIASEEEALADDLAEAPNSEQVTATLEEAREEIRADLEREKLQTKSALNRLTLPRNRCASSKTSKSRMANSTNETRRLDESLLAASRRRR